MEVDLHPVVRRARPSRSWALVPVMLAPALLAALVSYVSGYVDGRTDAYQIRRPLAPPAATAPAQAVPTPPPGTTIVNVAPGVTDIGSLVPLRPGELVLDINGVAMSLPKTILHPKKMRGGYLDITTTERHIVVLFH